jgi:multiple antibiotic resistance protein
LLLWNAFLIAFSALLPLINPLGSALVFVGLVGEAPPEVYRSLARRIAINNVIFLAMFELLGSAILNFFGISLPIVQVAGGIVIAGIGWSVLNEKDSEANARNKREELQLNVDESLRNLQQKAFYPFTFPVTSGPGTLVVVLTLSARSSGTALAANVLGHVGLFLAIIVLSGLVYVCYGYAPKITASIAPSTAHGILRVVAFILLCIGVQIAWNGLSVLLTSVLKHQGAS